MLTVIIVTLAILLLAGHYERSTRGRWVVRRTIWPYEDGYGVVYYPRRVVIDTGLTREHAKAIVDDLNRRHVRPG